MATHTLREHPQHVPIAGPLIVVVMDGVGIGRCDRGDAVWLADTPTLDRLARGPTLRLRAHGLAVGLPSDSDMGNSEVGHNIIARHCLRALRLREPTAGGTGRRYCPLKRNNWSEPYRACIA